MEGTDQGFASPNKSGEMAEGQTPTNTFWYQVSCPVRFLGQQFKHGGVKGSIFSLITAILGSGTITLPYLAYNNGIAMAGILVLFGAILSYFCGMLLVSCADKVGSDKYEDFAAFCFGRKMVLVTGWSNVSTLLGFVVSYIVFLKNLVPHILYELFGEGNIPKILGKGRYTGQIFWATIYSFLILTPLSMPRQIGALRFNSMFGVCCSFYLVMCITFMFFLDRGLVENIGDAFREAHYFKITVSGMLDAVPFVVFAFMYQPNIPIIYRELTTKTYGKMNKVVTLGSSFVIVLYILASTFGYLGLVGDKKRLDILADKNNILEVPYDNVAFKVAIIGLMFAIFAAAPICVLPAKDAFEEIVFAKNKMSMKWNVITTIIMCFVSYVCAIVIPGIGDVITILGCTTNPLIGFILPIIFYLKIVDDVPLWKTICCWVVLIFIIAVSIASFVLFVIDKVKGESEE